MELAVVGGGIVGLILATGLLKRNFKVTVFEQSTSFREIGAGVAFTANAIQCMRKLDPRIVEALGKVATTNGVDANKPNDYLQWVDGWNALDENPENLEEKMLFKLYAGYRGFEGCHRAHLLDEIIELMPEDVVQFKKRLDTLVDDETCEKVQLNFCDGSVAHADAGKSLLSTGVRQKWLTHLWKVIGCDGIKSRVRQLLLGENNPASFPHYSHKCAFRGLIPMEEAIAALGETKARNQYMHVGPGAHVLTFPVAKHALMNVVAFVDDAADWEDDEKMTAPATRAEVVEAFSSWGPCVRAITKLLPPWLDKWAIFDTYDHPAPAYAKGRVCMIGDAAHASAPHHGAGAGLGIEDALSLSKLVELVDASLRSEDTRKQVALQNAFAVFDSVRRERTQWLVRSSRHVCDVYEWTAEGVGNDVNKCFEEIEWRSHRIWHFDIEKMLEDAETEYSRRLMS